MTRWVNSHINRDTPIWLNGDVITYRLLKVAKIQSTYVSEGDEIV